MASKRNKKKAKRFGAGSAKPIVDASTYGAGNAFSSAGAESLGGAGGAANGTMRREAGRSPYGTGRGAKRRPLLVVDGYNIIYATPRYEALVYRDTAGDPLSRDVYPRAREALISDVAAFAQASYDAVVVFDGAGNKNPDRPNLPQAGVQVIFSPSGVSADRVIEQLCTDAREQGRAVTVATSDGTIQAVAMGKGVTRISARMFMAEITAVNESVQREMDETPPMKLTLADRLSPAARAKLAALRDRG